MADEYIFCECCNCVTCHRVTLDHGVTVKRCQECGTEYNERSRDWHARRPEREKSAKKER